MEKGLESQPPLLGSGLCFYQYITTLNWIYNNQSQDSGTQENQKIMKEANKTILVTYDQAEMNQKIIKNVESNVLIMSFELTDMNLVVFGLIVMDLIELSNDLKLIKTNA
ncbi:hypothetical protein RF11_02354 [Thelohanellus kitauei]|uniref:Uncharacterized protein n=1 Tax=Thelohanellus kitauei TaxID=669202 RepID=A0A0C2N170_THEKT|nr:hypothetical protein RF11_02354 [Thelohanellus kitauei]